MANMGSLLSALSSWRPTLGAGTYTILGDTNGLFERYLTEPGTSSSVPSLTELPSLIVAQLLPEVALGSKGPARRIPDAPRLSPQLASRMKILLKTCAVYSYLIRSRRQWRLFIRAVELHGGGVRRCRHHFSEDFQVGG